MSDRRYTLTDVMLGVDKHGLVDKLTEQCFAFLIGLILEANRLGFKNPFDLTLNQTMAAGGGDSRQTVSRRRNQLSKYKIDGKSIMMYTAGNRSKNTTATYQIDYNLLCSYNDVWQGPVDTPSQIWDRSATESGRQADSSATILRSDQKREERIPPTPLNLVSTGNESENEEAAGDLGSPEEEGEEELRMFQKATRIGDLIRRKWQGQIHEGPDIGSCKAALREFDWDHKLLEIAVTEAPVTLNSPTPMSAMNLVSSIARRIQNEGNGGVSPELIAQREEEIQKLKAELEKAREKPEENAVYISQYEHKLELKEIALERLRAE